MACITSYLAPKGVIICVRLSINFSVFIFVFLAHIYEDHYRRSLEHSLCVRRAFREHKSRPVAAQKYFVLYVNELTSLIDSTLVYLAPGCRLALTMVVHSSSLDDSVYIKASLLKSSSCNCKKIITIFISSGWSWLNVLFIWDSVKIKFL